MAPWPGQFQIKESEEGGDKVINYSSRHLSKEKPIAIASKETTPLSSPSSTSVTTNPLELEEPALKSLLEEAISYKSPKDRAGKSEIFQVLLNEAENKDASGKKKKLSERCNGYSESYGGGSIGNGHDVAANKSYLNNILGLGEKDKRRKKQKRDRSKCRNNGNNRKSKFSHSLKINPAPHYGGGSSSTATFSNNNNAAQKNACNKALITTNAIKMPICTTAVTSSSCNMNGSNSQSTLSGGTKPDFFVMGLTTQDLTDRVVDKTILSRDRKASETEEDEEGVEMQTFDTKSYTTRATLEISGTEDNSEMDSSYHNKNCSELDISYRPTDMSRRNFDLSTLSRAKPEDIKDGPEVELAIKGAGSGRNMERKIGFTHSTTVPIHLKNATINTKPYGESQNVFTIPPWNIPGFHYMNFAIENISSGHSTMFAKNEDHLKNILHNKNSEDSSNTSYSIPPPETCSRSPTRVEIMKARRSKKYEKHEMKQDQVFLSENVDNYIGDKPINHIMKYIESDIKPTDVVKKELTRKDKSNDSGKVNNGEGLVEPKNKKQIETKIVKDKEQSTSVINHGRSLEELNNTKLVKKIKKSGVDGRKEKQAIADKIINLKKHSSLEEIKESVKKHTKQNSADNQYSKQISKLNDNRKCISNVENGMVEEISDARKVGKKNKKPNGDANLEKVKSLENVDSSDNVVKNQKKVKKSVSDEIQAIRQINNKQSKINEISNENANRVIQNDDNGSKIAKKNKKQICTEEISLKEGTTDENSSNNKTLKKGNIKEVSKQSDVNIESNLKKVKSLEDVNNISNKNKKNKKQLSVDDNEHSNRQTNGKQPLKKVQSLEEINTNCSKSVKKQKKVQNDEKVSVNTIFPKPNLKKVQSLEDVNANNKISRKNKKQSSVDDVESIKNTATVKPVLCENKNFVNTKSNKPTASSSKTKSHELKKVRSLEDINQDEKKSKKHVSTTDGKQNSLCNKLGTINLKKGRSLEDINKPIKKNKKSNLEEARNKQGSSNKRPNMKENNLDEKNCKKNNNLMVFENQEYDEIDKEMSNDVYFYMDTDFAEYSGCMESEFHLVTKRHRKKKQKNELEQNSNIYHEVSDSFLPHDFNESKNDAANVYQKRKCSSDGRSKHRRKSISSAVISDKASDSDSIHSLPVTSNTPKHKIKKGSTSSGGTPQTSYADITKTSQGSNNQIVTNKDYKKRSSAKARKSISNDTTMELTISPVLSSSLDEDTYSTEKYEELVSNITSKTSSKNESCDQLELSQSNNLKTLDVNIDDKDIRINGFSNNNIDNNLNNANSDNVNNNSHNNLNNNKNNHNNTSNNNIIKNNNNKTKNGNCNVSGKKDDKNNSGNKIGKNLRDKNRSVNSDTNNNVTDENVTDDTFVEFTVKRSRKGSKQNGAKKIQADVNHDLDKGNANESVICKSNTTSTMTGIERDKLSTVFTQSVPVKTPVSNGSAISTKNGQSGKKSIQSNHEPKPPTYNVSEVLQFVKQGWTDALKTLQMSKVSDSKNPQEKKVYYFDSQNVGVIST